jgi:hypothetical protein
VGSDGVVLDAPVLDQHLGLEQGGEGLHGEQFVAEPAAEALHLRVLPWCAGLDVAGARAGEPAPVAQGVGGQLGPLSQRMNRGVVLPSTTRRSSTATVASASILRSTWIARASRVCSSTMLSSFNLLPSWVWSNW